MPAAPALIAGAATVGGALISSSGAKSAANASAKADAAAIAEQRRQFDLTRGDFAPYRQVGSGALNQLAALYGIQQSTQQPTSSYSDWLQQNGGASGLGGWAGLGNNYANYENYLNTSQPQQQQSAPDYSTFYNSPDYGFARTEGQRGLEQSAAARGGAFSGNALKELSRFNQGLASQQYGNYVNRLQSLAGIGQSATQNLGQLGAQYSGNIGNLLSSQGTTRASGIQASGNIWGNALQGLGGIAYDWYKNRQGGS